MKIAQNTDICKLKYINLRIIHSRIFIAFDHRRSGQLDKEILHLIVSQFSSLLNCICSIYSASITSQHL